MRNSVTCPNCNSENPFYNSICSICRFYLRDRVYNIDLWATLSSLVESPSKAFRTIIFSEHKNFMIFVFLFVCIKYLINARFVSMISLGDFQSTVSLQISYLMLTGAALAYFLVFSLVYKLSARLNKIQIRLKDTFAIIVYSQVPFLFGLIILFTLELVIFGDYLFSINPSPLIIKGIIAYLFLALESGLVIWNIFLVFKAFRVQSQNFVFGYLSSLAFVVLFWTLIYFCSLFVFTI
jgi:hypothetical protein